MQVTFPDGSSTELQVHRTAAADPLVVLCLPAMGVRAKYYEKLAHTLTEQGCHAVLADHRGTGRSSVRPSRRVSFGYADVLELELPAIVEAVCREFGTQRIAVVGHSLGGQLGVLFSAVSDRISHIVLVASGSAWWAKVPGIRSLARFAGLQLVLATTLLCGYLPGWFPFAGKEAKQLVLDWGHEALTGRYKVAGSQVDYEAALARSSVPALFINFPGDNYAPAACASYLASKLRSAHVTVRSLSAEQLGITRSDHFRWAAHPQTLVRDTVKWIRTHAR
ncbi:alpha/beta fold hydrolase [Kribbella sp. NPDC050470]|uniref:alpha/beta hydrolase family protein n=1 Tax=unclassified Kribbella TaxID=2644121 RepID=UPI00379BD252